MRKPRSQHARLLSYAAGFRDALDYLDDISTPDRETLLKRHRQQIEKARAIRLAAQPDPLWAGTIHPFHWSWFGELADPPDPSRAAAATPSPH